MLQAETSPFPVPAIACKDRFASEATHEPMQARAYHQGLDSLESLESLESLFVIHTSSSLVLFACHFKQRQSHAIVTSREMDDIHGGAINMIDSLLGEILASDGHIRRIMFDDKVLDFIHGSYCTFVACSWRQDDRVFPFLRRFAGAFEQHFVVKLGAAYNVDLDEYQDAITRVWGKGFDGFAGGSALETMRVKNA